MDQDWLWVFTALAGDHRQTAAGMLLSFLSQESTRLDRTDTTHCSKLPVL